MVAILPLEAPLRENSQAATAARRGTLFSSFRSSRPMGGAFGNPQSLTMSGTRIVVAWLLAIAASATSPAETVRVATFNVSLYGEKSGDVLKRLETGTDPQAKTLAEIIQR